ncbi:ArsA family ATPase [Synechococcus sp. Nb3U1]|uniref:ArsA family ATPase n=1 Tax=Synechococcus sp. Nb3U1 TaxID=1914529 RepID=UPI001F15B965|nr:ArsA family ATPase [Synechococcus sp. Nb3U1]MCF2972497.1 ArsA family ATPase [Synechococcus sp. Nb3U1]
MEGIPLYPDRPLISAAHRLVLFSGKGGVGKTTLTCALARQLAQADPQRRLLLISTDPAHSLGDVLDVPVTEQAQPLPDCPNLQVRALQAEVLLAAFKQTYGAALELIAERGSWFGREDLLPVWDLAWPGVDELMAILEVNRLLAGGELDTVILDTAPTGHTLRLLELPDFLDNVLAVFATFQAKHRELSQALTGTYRADEADAFLAQLREELQAGKARLTDPESTSVWLVMLPEHLSLEETRRFCQQLQYRRLPIGGILVNQVLLGSPQPSPLYQARQQEQHRLLRALTEGLSGYPIWISPYQLQEPIGANALNYLVTQLLPLRDLPEVNFVPAHSQGIPTQLNTELRIPDLLNQGIRLALTGGKGGVGKTTVAGALAWNLAKRHPDKHLLLVSIDPAHSLGDLFEVKLGQDPLPLLPNLMGQEIDAAVVLEQFRQDYLEDIVAILAGESTPGVEVQYDPQAWRQLLQMPPPGLDEVMALLTVLEQSSVGQFDLVVLDTAPTGHMLRFLQMPQALEGWVSLALKLWLKYRDVVGRPELAQRLRGLLAQVRQLRQQLQDPQFVTFIPVFNPEQAVLAETQRLLTELDGLGIPHPYAVLNRIWVDSSDVFGQTVAQRHQELLAQLPEHLAQQLMVRIPFLHPPSLESIGAYLLESAETNSPQPYRAELG